MLQTDNQPYSYESAGFDKFLSRKKVEQKTFLEDNTSINIEQLSGNITGTIKFIRAGLQANLPITGEKAGELYFETDTGFLEIWDGNSWRERLFAEW